MTTERLYKVQQLRDDETPTMTSEPEGWADYCQEVWGERREFWWPSTNRAYRSRSAAVERAALIQRWGGKAIVLECTPTWRSVEVVRRERAVEAQFARVQALSVRLAKEKSKLELLTQGDPR